MIDTSAIVSVTEPITVSLPTDAEFEARIDRDIQSLWSDTQVGKARAQRTKQELKHLRCDLGDRLSSKKTLLALVGRAGNWAGFLRSAGIPRATADRLVNRHLATQAVRQNCLTEAISLPTDNDIQRLVRNLLPRLRRILTTPGSVVRFVEEVNSHLAAVGGSLSQDPAEGSGLAMAAGSCGRRAEEVSSLSSAA